MDIQEKKPSTKGLIPLTRIALRLILLSVTLATLPFTIKASKCMAPVSGLRGPVTFSEGLKDNVKNRKVFPLDRSRLLKIGEMTLQGENNSINIFVSGGNILSAKGIDSPLAYNLHFRHKSAKKNTNIGTIQFYISGNQLFFRGIKINEQHRHNQLAKPFILALEGLAYRYNLTLRAKHQRKPLLSKLLMDLGYTADRKMFEVFIGPKDEKSDELINLYIPGGNFTIGKRLLKSQGMVILDSPPPPNSNKVYIATTFSKPHQSASTWLDQLLQGGINIHYFKENLLLRKHLKNWEILKKAA